MTRVLAIALFLAGCAGAPGTANTNELPRAPAAERLGKLVVASGVPTGSDLELSGIDLDTQQRKTFRGIAGFAIHKTAGFARSLITVLWENDPSETILVEHRRAGWTKTTVEAPLDMLSPDGKRALDLDGHRLGRIVRGEFVPDAEVAVTAPYPVAWLPDGRIVLAVDPDIARASPAARATSLVAVDELTGEVTPIGELRTAEIASVRASPDGTHLVWEAEDRAAVIVAPLAELANAHRYTFGPERWARCAFAADHLVCEHRTDGVVTPYAGLTVDSIDLASGEMVRLGEDAAPTYGVGPVASPEGTHVAFSQYDVERYVHIVVSPVDRRAPREVASPPARANYALAWLR